MTKRFSLGIDLGTTNCAIALTDLEADEWVGRDVVLADGGEGVNLLVGAP